MKHSWMHAGGKAVGTRRMLQTEPESTGKETWVVKTVKIIHQVGSGGIVVTGSAP